MNGKVEELVDTREETGRVGIALDQMERPGWEWGEMNKIENDVNWSEDNEMRNNGMAFNMAKSILEYNYIDSSI